MQVLCRFLGNRDDCVALSVVFINIRIAAKRAQPCSVETQPRQLFVATATRVAIHIGLAVA